MICQPIVIIPFDLLEAVECDVEVWMVLTLSSKNHSGFGVIIGGFSLKLAIFNVYLLYAS